MTANTVNGSGNGARSGAQTLVLLASQLNVLILRGLAEGPRKQVELRRLAGSPAQTTLRAQLKRLIDLGAIAKNRRNRFPGVLEYELSPPGRELLFVMDAIEQWLAGSPDEPLPLGGSAAKAAIKALAEGWSTAMLRALAARPLSLTDLDRVIGSLSYPSLERRLAAMRLAGQIEARPGGGSGRPYAVTPWLREGVGPLVAAIQWERRHQPAAMPPITPLDVEAAFLLAVPLLQLPEELSGSCRMAAEVANGDKPRLAGVLVEVEDGRIASCSTQLTGRPDARALGSASAWLDAVTEGDTDRIEMNGDCRLARTLLDGLHEALFNSQAREHLDVSHKISKDGLN